MNIVWYYPSNEHCMILPSNEHCMILHQQWTLYDITPAINIVWYYPAMNIVWYYPAMNIVWYYPAMCDITSAMSTAFLLSTLLSWIVITDLSPDDDWTLAILRCLWSDIMCRPFAHYSMSSSGSLASCYVVKFSVYNISPVALLCASRKSLGAQSVSPLFMYEFGSTCKCVTLCCHGDSKSIVYEWVWQHVQVCDWKQ